MDRATQIWNQLPACILVRFKTRTTWRVDGIDEDNVLPVAPQKKRGFWRKGGSGQYSASRGGSFHWLQGLPQQHMQPKGKLAKKALSWNTLIPFTMCIFNVSQILERSEEQSNNNFFPIILLKF